jgi:hypothetical protein
VRGDFWKNSCDQNCEKKKLTSEFEGKLFFSSAYYNKFIKRGVFFGVFEYIQKFKGVLCKKKTELWFLYEANYIYFFISSI